MYSWMTLYTPNMVKDTPMKDNKSQKARPLKVPHARLWFACLIAPTLEAPMYQETMLGREAKRLSADKGLRVNLLGAVLVEAILNKLQNVELTVVATIIMGKANPASECLGKNSFYFLSFIMHILAIFP